MNRKYRADDFDFEIRDMTIPRAPRPLSEHKLLHYNAKINSISHTMMYDIADLLGENDLLLFNDSKVMPVAFYLADDKFILVIDPHIDKTKDIRLICPFKPNVGDIFEFEFGIVELVSHEPGWDIYHANIELVNPNLSLRDILSAYGQFPLPIYIPRLPTQDDEKALQGYYASLDGSIAPPVAGTHFNDEIIENLKEKGVRIATITLHVGYGTFRSYKTEYIDDHVMDSEYFIISRESINEIKAALSSKNRIIAIGTTAARVAETIGADWEKWSKTEKSISGETTLFIKPPYQPKIISGLLTNFQYPRLPVITMAATFVGLENLRIIYETALTEKYMFYSYGDVMLLEF